MGKPIWKMVKKGWSGERIARRLGVKPSTGRGYVSRYRAMKAKGEI